MRKQQSSVERKAADPLFDAQQVGRAIFQESTDALFLFDPETDVVLDVNPAAVRLSGFPRDQLLTQPVTYWVQFMGAEQRGTQRLRHAASHSGIFFSYDGYYLRTALDIWIPVNLSISRLHIQPKTLALMTARDIREQRAAHFQLREKEVKLREGEGRLQAILDHSPAAIYVKDLEGRYLLINRTFEQLTRINREKILGKSDFEIFTKDVAEVFRANDQRVLTSGEPEEYEEVNGFRTSLSIKFPLRDSRGRVYALCGISNDITERKRAEEERNRFFTLSTDMLCIAGFDGYFKRISPSWESTLGWKERELLAQPYLDFVHPDDVAATVTEAQRLADRGVRSIYFENRYRCADGSYRWLQWNAVPLPSHQLVYAVARDVTRQKEDEEKLAESASELAKAYQQTKELAAELEKAISSERTAHQQLKDAQSQLVQSEKLVALGQMIAGVAHEINNPLAYVANNIAVLTRDVEAVRKLYRLYQRGSPMIAEHDSELFQSISTFEETIDAEYIMNNLDGVLTRSRDGLKRIQQIVRDLRDFARLDGSDLSEFDINAGIESTLNIVRGQAGKKRVGLEVDLARVPRIFCYAAKLNQVVLNLLTNAIDACPPNGKVIVRTDYDDKMVQLHVLDNGHGIPERIREKIFDPFFTTKPPGQGTGLGLSISHRIIKDHGGRITVESQEGHGTHFTIHLPREPSQVKRGEKHDTS